MPPSPIATAFSPRQVLLFSGHRMDAPDRPQPRFPATLEAAAAREIARALDTLGADASDLALCQAAAGGDLLFLEACVQRGVHCQVLLPLAEPAFVQRSLWPSTHGAAWQARWQALKPRLADPPRVMPDELGPAAAEGDTFERCNLWLLDTALAWGAHRLQLICLWDGAAGDGPGGTQHMVQEVERRGGQVCWIDTRRLAAP
ncbi:MAG TPA: hypothetical protein VLA16_04145 [Ideonella sp.]|nr:hypothetical protein [Ideonella sp.]